MRWIQILLKHLTKEILQKKNLFSNFLYFITLIYYFRTWQASGDGWLKDPAQNMEAGFMGFLSRPECRHSFIAIVFIVEDCRNVALGPPSYVI